MDLFRASDRRFQRSVVESQPLKLDGRTGANNRSKSRNEREISSGIVSLKELKNRNVSVVGRSEKGECDLKERTGWFKCKPAGGRDHPGRPVSPVFAKLRVSFQGSARQKCAQFGYAVSLAALPCSSGDPVGWGAMDTRPPLVKRNAQSLLSGFSCCWFW